MPTATQLSAAQISAAQPGRAVRHANRLMYPFPLRTLAQTDGR